MSITYLKKNRAKLTVSVGGRSNRKRYSKTVTYTTKKELEKMYQRFVDEVMHNPLVDTTVDELVDMYIRSRKTLGIEATTIKGYETAAARIPHAIKVMEARSLTSFQVQAVVTDLSDKYKPKTVRNTMSLLSSAYEEAVRLGQLAKNPCKGIKLPKKDAPNIDIFNEDEIKRFLAALREARIDYKVAYELALFCGLRRSEILGLKEEDVNLVFRTVSVNKTRHRVDKEDIEQGTKTESSNRKLSIPAFVVEDIKTLIEKHHSFEYRRSDYLIQDGFGKPMTPSALTTQIRRIEERAGLPNVSLHDLRHTFASMLNNAHVDIAMISRELGHSNITTTMSVYMHVFGNVSDSSRNIADSLNNKFEDAEFRDSAVAPIEEEKTAEA